MAPKPLVIPDYFEPLLAYRTWQCLDPFTELRPLANQDHAVWTPGARAEAKCTSYRGERDTACTCPNCGHRYNTHVAPVKGCSCGFYGFKDPVAMMRQMTSQQLRWNRYSTQIFGAVHLWGKVIEHKSGYRAQYAYPALLCVPNDKAAASLRASYKCEVFVGTFTELLQKDAPPEIKPAPITSFGNGFTSEDIPF